MTEADYQLTLNSIVAIMASVAAITGSVAAVFGVKNHTTGQSNSTKLDTITQATAAPAAPRPVEIPAYSHSQNIPVAPPKP